MLKIGYDILSKSLRVIEDHVAMVVFSFQYIIGARIFSSHIIWWRVNAMASGEGITSLLWKGAFIVGRVRKSHSAPGLIYCEV
jgi:hypothetical protein